MVLDTEKLSDDEKKLFGMCGIFCGACDAFIGEQMEHAKKLLEIMDGMNFEDVASFFLGTTEKEYKKFRKIMKKIAKSKKCEGCGGGGGNPVCPMKICCAEKGYLTCAECDFIKDTGKCGKTGDPGAFPLTRTDTMMETITTRYSNWNIENLKGIQEKGYREFCNEMKKKVGEGFRTYNVISKEKVFSKIMQSQAEK